MPKPADLLAYLFDDAPSPIATTVERWMVTSPRFTAFVETYRDKIRKKLRVSPDPESTLDVLAELEIARALLADRRFAVAYEPYASAKRRGPDFAVTYRANYVFNIEVARLRPVETGDLTRKEDNSARIVRILLYKLGQMQPAMPNILTIHVSQELAQTIDLQTLLQPVKTRVEGKDPTFYAATRYTTPASFYKDFLHLSSILLWSATPNFWINKQSRPLIDEKILRLLTTLPTTLD